MGKTRKVWLMLIVVIAAISLTFTISLADEKAAIGNASTQNLSTQDLSIQNISQLHEAIDSAGAHWTAGKTSVSDISQAQKMKLCGTKPSPNTEEKMAELTNASKSSEEKDHKTALEDNATQGIGLELPELLDWRNYYEKDWMTPIKDQGPCGSCSAFGTLAAYEANAKLAANNPDYDPDISEQDLVSCAYNGIDCQGCNGAYVRGYLNWTSNKGATLEACFPYIAKDPITSPLAQCYKRCDTTAACDPKKHYIRGWNPIDSGDTISMQEALMRGPIIATMAVYNDFFSYTGGVYEHVSGGLAGWHAICLVGWGTDKTTGEDYWIGKNSWGTGWGENGWFKIKRGTNESYIEDETYVLDLQRDTIGVYRPSAGIGIFDYNNDGLADNYLTDFPAGKDTDIPVSGSWEPNGVHQYVENGWGDGWGLFRPSTGQWFLDTSFGGAAEIVINYGMKGDLPVSGDWNGDSRDGIGVYRPSEGTWYLDDNIDGITDRTLQFGSKRDLTVTGDWNGDGKAEIGLFNPLIHTFLLDTNMDEKPELIVLLGSKGDLPVAGDWNADGRDEIGVFRPSSGEWLLDYNFDGTVDQTIDFGHVGDKPLPGNWFDNPWYTP